MRREINVRLSDEELRRRLAHWQAPPAERPGTVLEKYARMVSCASLGAVTSRIGS